MNVYVVECRDDSNYTRWIEGVYDSFEKAENSIKTIELVKTDEYDNWKSYAFPYKEIFIYEMEVQ